MLIRKCISVVHASSVAKSNIVEQPQVRMETAAVPDTDGRNRAVYLIFNIRSTIKVLMIIQESPVISRDHFSGEVYPSSSRLQYSGCLPIPLKLSPEPLENQNLCIGH